MKIKRPRFWYFIFRPSWWFRNYNTSKELSKFIIDKLEEGYRPTKNKYNISLCGIQLWDSNYPYAYGTIVEDGKITSSSDIGILMPSRTAVKMLHDSVSSMSSLESKIKEYLDTNSKSG